MTNLVANVNPASQKEKSVSNMSRRSFRNGNRNRQSLKNERLRQNATHRAWLLQQRREEIVKNLQDTPETTLSESQPSTNPTLFL